MSPSRLLPRRVYPALLLLLPGALPAPAQEIPPAPAATPSKTHDTLHGVDVPDPFRWLEDGTSAATRAWVDAQNTRSRSALDAWPHRKALAEEIRASADLGSLGTPRPAGARLFFTRRQIGWNQPVLMVRARDGKEGSGRVLVDPNALDAAGTTSLDFWTPSPDGSHMAYGLSVGGSEQSVIHILAVASGKNLPEVIPNAPHASIAWLPDASGFYYTRLPAPGSVPAGEEHYHQALFLHQLGSDPTADREVYRPERKEDRIGCEVSRDGHYLAIGVFRGWSETFMLVRDLRVPDAPFATFGQGTKSIFTGTIVGDHLVVQTNWEAPRYRILSYSISDPAAAPREIIAQGDDILEGFAVVGGKIVTRSLVDACARLHVHALDGALLSSIDLPTLGTIRSIHSEREGHEFYFSFTSFAVPGVVYRYDLTTSKLTEWGRIKAPSKAEDFHVEQVRVPSEDGTLIPLFLVHRRGLKIDGRRPTVLYGYGGFNVNMTPSFLASALPFLERGGVYALAVLRGGGEYGEEWHRAGMLANKQNVFDDFLAAARWLWTKGYTHPGKLAIMGGSNGGLLVAAALTQAPSLFRAVICAVPLTDMIRYQRFSIARLWIPEYGSSEDPEAFKWLYAYSPYHRVRSGVFYPAVLITAGENDSRVDPLHARKFAAALQNASSSNLPILLWIEKAAGHGQGKPASKRIEALVDRWAFLYEQLAVPFGDEAKKSAPRGKD